MKQGKDYRFDLSTFLKEQEQTKRLYVYKWQIENNGCYKIQLETETVKVYTPQLAIVLASQELSVLNLDNQTQVTIKGLEYLETYVKAYKEGQQYFDSKYNVSPNIIFGDSAEQYVMGIHENFFHVQHSGIIKGWGYVKHNFNNILTHKNVQEFGYYSGIVNKVEEQVKEYRFQFVKFEKCKHDSTITEQTEKETVKLKVKQIALIHVYEGTHLTRGNADEIAAQYGYTAKTSGEGLFQDYIGFLSTVDRKAKPIPCTPKKLKNKIILFESVISYLSDNCKQRAIDEINILKTILENEYQ